MPLDRSRHQDVLIEAATVLKKSGAVAANLKKAVMYLEAIAAMAVQDLKVFAMLAEMYAKLGNRNRYEVFRDKGRCKLDTEGDSVAYRVRDAADNALTRAEAIMDGVSEQ